MNASYPSQSFATSLFADADTQYATMKEALTSADFQGKTEAEVQRWLSEEQRELMRRLFQAHLTLRGRSPGAGVSRRRRWGDAHARAAGGAAEAGDGVRNFGGGFDVIHSAAV